VQRDKHQPTWGGGETGGHQQTAAAVVRRRREQSQLQTGSDTVGNGPGLNHCLNVLPLSKSPPNFEIKLKSLPEFQK
jgi:hypothetical protein